MQDQHRFNTKAWLLWTAGFLAFPIAGILAEALTGRINDFSSALLGGMVAGAVIGTGQWLVARRLLDAQTWIPATALAMGIGLGVGAWAVGYGTSLGELALMGFITGIPLGVAQAYLLRDRVANAWLWAAAMPLLWALGWTVSDLRRRQCRQPVRGLRRQRRDHLHGPVGGAVGPAPRRHQPSRTVPAPRPEQGDGPVGPTQNLVGGLAPAGPGVAAMRAKAWSAGARHGPGTAEEETMR